MLKIIPLGGLGEIGLNMMIFEYKGSMFIIDAGLMFPEDYMLGVDIVIPDMSYLRANRSKLLGIVLTHAHEDHIGALPYLLKEMNVPVFGTSFTIGIVKNKLEDHGLIASALLHVITTNETLKIGDFELEFISVNHSIVGGVGVSIMTPYGRIIHTGDFKISSTSLTGIKTDVNRFAKCGEQGVLALLSDSTNVEREGYRGRSSYALSEGGGYYASRFAVAEALNKLKRQAGVIVFREIYDGYIMPVGVWEVRENIRKAFEKKPRKFTTLKEALEDIRSRLRIPLEEYLKRSNFLLQQKLCIF